jgi:hypothetical protein
MRRRHPSKGEHMKDHALKLALEGAANYIDVLGGDSRKYRQALAAPVQKRPQNCGTGYCSCIECVMEPAAVQEPVAWMQDSIELYVQDRPSAYYTIPLYTIPPNVATPLAAPYVALPRVQEPVAKVDANDEGYWADILPDRTVKVGQFLYAAAQPSPVQEPVAWMDGKKIGCVNHDCDQCKAAAQRQWVGLTDVQRDDIYYCVEGGASELETWREQARAIEAKLKEKNT